MMDQIYEKAVEAAEFINKKTQLKPEVAIILGGYLGDFADTLQEKVVIPYAEIPHFKILKSQGHPGNLVFGKLSNGKIVVCMQGRYHSYEGQHIHNVVFPVRVLFILGIKRIVLINSGCALNKMLTPGNFVILKDHVNLMFGTSALVGPNDERFGPQFPDQSQVYNIKMQEIFDQGVKQLGLEAHRGVYALFNGPSFQTEAEAQIALRIGCDCSGMSTVQEAIVANHMGMQIAGISCITSIANGISDIEISEQELQQILNKQKQHLNELLNKCLPQL